MFHSKDSGNNGSIMFPVSRHTVSRRLAAMDLPGRVAKKKPLLTARHRQLHLQWAHDHQHWGIEDWNNVFFSDETRLHLIQSRQMRYVRRPPGQRDVQRYSRPTVHSGGGKVDIWASFSADGTHGFKAYRGNLNSMTYQEILAEAILPLDLSRNGLSCSNRITHQPIRVVQPCSSSTRMVWMFCNGPLSLLI